METEITTGKVPNWDENWTQEDEADMLRDEQAYWASVEQIVLDIAAQPAGVK